MLNNTQKSYEKYKKFMKSKLSNRPKSQILLHKNISDRDLRNFEL